MEVKVSTDGRIVLPAELRRRDQICAGQRFRIERLEAGQYVLTREPMRYNAGLVDWLLACPERGWFQPISSESTSDLRSFW